MILIILSEAICRLGSQSLERYKQLFFQTHHLLWVHCVRHPLVGFRAISVPTCHQVSAPSVRVHTSANKGSSNISIILLANPFMLMLNVTFPACSSPLFFVSSIFSLVLQAASSLTFGFLRVVDVWSLTIILPLPHCL